MADPTSFSTSYLLPSPQLTKSKVNIGSVEVKKKGPPLKPLELDAIGPQAYWGREFIPRAFNGLVSPDSQYSVVHIGTNELHVPVDDVLIGIHPTFTNDNLLNTQLSSTSISDTRKHKTHTLESLISDNLYTDDPIRKRIENGTNGGIQVMQWKFMRHARLTMNSFIKSIDAIASNENCLRKNHSKDEIKVSIISRSEHSNIGDHHLLPLDSPQRLITPDTVSAGSFFRIFDVAKVGPWKIVGELGSGSTSKVKLAIHELTGVKAAVKIIPREIPETLLTPEIIAAQKALDQAFEKEALAAGKPQTAKGKAPTESRAVRDSRIHREISILRVLTSSTHPSILKLKEAIWGERLVLLVLDYVSGGSLLSRLSSKGRFSEEDARPIFRSLLSGISFLHSAGIVHRDLKIENVLLDSSEKHSFLIDFGLANFFYSMATIKLSIAEDCHKRLPSSSPHKNSLLLKRPEDHSPSIGSSFHLLDTFCGSLYYAAPELLAGRAYPGPAVDVWSLGVILFAMVAGRVPFDVPGDHVPSLHSQILRGKPTSMLPQGTSQEFINLISKMLTVDPKNRATAVELLMEDPWVLDSLSSPELVCTGIACTPDPNIQVIWGPKVPGTQSPCCRGRKKFIVINPEKKNISVEDGSSLERTSNNVVASNLGQPIDQETTLSHHPYTDCCPCCLELFNVRFSILDQNLWAKLNNSTIQIKTSAKENNTTNLAAIAIDELEGLLGHQYPQILLRALLESFFLNSKKVTPCSPMCPWPLVAMFILLVIKNGKNSGVLDTLEIDETKLWSIFHGIPPPKAPLRLMEDCRDEIFSQLHQQQLLENYPNEKDVDVTGHNYFSSPRIIYLKGLLRVDFLDDSSWRTSSEMLDRLIMTLGHLPGVIGGVVPVSVSRLTHEHATKMHKASVYHPSHCKYIVTLQIPPDDRWKEAQELSIRSISGISLQIFPMMSMSVELVRIFWTQSFGLVFEHLSGSLETFYQIKMLVHRMVERGEAPRRTPLLWDEEMGH